MHQRDAWIWLLEPAWVFIGWILESAKTTEDICKVFGVLKSRSNSYLIDPFLRGTTERSTVASIVALREEYEKAGGEWERANKAHNDRLEEYEEAKRISLGVTDQSKKQLEDDLSQRKERIRCLQIARSRAKARLRKYSLLRQKYARAKARSRGAFVPVLGKKIQRIEADLAADDKVCRDLKTRLASITPSDRRVATEELRSRQEKLDLATETLKKATALFDELHTKLLNQEAFLFREELLNFDKSGKYAIEPRQIAKALAGLPFMKCRRSAEGCLPLKSSIPVMSDHELFLFVCSLWERRNKRRSLPLVDWFRKEITRLPKWFKEQGDRRDNRMRSRLTVNWYFLKRAIEDVQALKFGKIPQPYFIAQRFLADSLTWRDRWYFG